MTLNEAHADARVKSIDGDTHYVIRDPDSDVENYVTCDGPDLLGYYACVTDGGIVAGYTKGELLV